MEGIDGIGSFGNPGSDIDGIGNSKLIGIAMSKAMEGIDGIGSFGNPGSDTDGRLQLTQSCPFPLRVPQCRG